MALELFVFCVLIEALCKFRFTTSLSIVLSSFDGMKVDFVCLLAPSQFKITLEFVVAPSSLNTLL